MPTAMSQAAHPPARQMGERELIWMMAMLMALQAFGIDAMLPALGVMAEELGAAGNDRQLVIGSYFFGSAIGAFFPGAFADRFGRRPVLAAALGAYVLLSAACALITDFDVLLAVRFVQGLACAGLSVVPAAIVRDRVGGDKMARLMSLIMMIFLVVPLAAPAIGQVIMLAAGWRSIFGIMVIVGILVGSWVWGRLPESLVAENRQDIVPAVILKNMAKALRVRGSIGYVIGSGLVFGSLFGFLNSSQQLIGEAFGMGEWFGVVFGVAVLGMVIASFANSRIVERFGARRVSQTALFGFLGIAATMVWSAGRPDQTLAELIILICLSNAMMGFIGANFASIAMQPFGQIAGAASSAHSVVRLGLGSLLGAYILSLIHI